MLNKANQTAQHAVTIAQNYSQRTHSGNKENNLNLVARLAGKVMRLNPMAFKGSAKSDALEAIWASYEAIQMLAGDSITPLSEHGRSTDALAHSFFMGDVADIFIGSDDDGNSVTNAGNDSTYQGEDPEHYNWN